MELVTKRRRDTYTIPSPLETLAAFEVWEAEQPDDYHYEFYSGEIIRKDGMKQLEMFMVDILLNCFDLTGAKKEGGRLFQEVDVYIDENRKRIADLAFFSRQQILSTLKGDKEIPALAIELLSESESFIDTELKVKDYFDAGVQLVWYISSVTKRIYAYTAPCTIRIFAAGEIATAEPAISDFAVEVDKLFTPS